MVGVLQRVGVWEFYLLVICSNNIFYLALFSTYYHFTVYVTVCNLIKSLCFNTTVEITGHICFFGLHVNASMVVNTCYIY